MWQLEMCNIKICMDMIKNCITVSENFQISCLCVKGKGFRQTFFISLLKQATAIWEHSELWVGGNDFFLKMKPKTMHINTIYICITPFTAPICRSHTCYFFFLTIFGIHNNSTTQPMSKPHSHVVKVPVRFKRPREF